MSVELSGITKSFGKATVLPPLSLSINTGELIALLGPSGCGKTTTLRIIAGLESPDAGTVRIEGRDVSGLPPEARGLGMVFQQYAIWPHRTVFGNVAYPLERLTPRLLAHEVTRRVSEALELVHLGPLAQRRPHELSGGQLQRVALARALVARPRVLLLDEPLSNLDAALREELRAEIRSLQRKLAITTVLVTHDQEEALSIADRIALLNAGRIEQLGTPAEVYLTPRTGFVARFVGGGNVIATHCATGMLRAGTLSLPAPAGTPDGPVELVARPEDVRVSRAGTTHSASAVVTERLYLGDRVELRLDAGGVALRALCPVEDTNGILPGDSVQVTLSRWSPLGK